jgi:hypothetical protein
MNPEIPIFKLIVTDDDDIGINYVALVDKPATGELWVAFNESKPLEIEFKSVDEEKRMVMGALMVANLPIPRVNEKNEPFLVVLDAENIDKAMYKLAKKGKQSNVNLMHDSKQVVGGVYMQYAWVINKEIGMPTPKGFNEVPDGSVFAMYKIDNESVWQDVKAGKFKGFSIEGMLVQEPLVDPPDNIVAEMLDALEGSNLK